MMKLRRSITEGISLPEEILRMILLNFPTKTLVRFSCVSKEWRDLIRDPSFGNEHGSHFVHKNSHNQAVFLLGQFGSSSFFDDGYMRFNELLLTTKPEAEVGDQGNCDTNLGNNSNFRFSVLSSGLDLPYDVELPYKIYGACRGILCISKSSSRCHVYLCNPTIRECLRLPASCWNMRGSWDVSVLDFGFDAPTNDYKVIRVGRFGKNGSNSACAEIYRLSTNCWTKLNLIPGTFMGNLAPAGGVFFNGSCYWSGKFKFSTAILKFDFSSELFSVILHPYSNTTVTWASATPSVLGDSLALILVGMRGLVEVWVQKEEDDEIDGEEKESLLSWSKKCCLRLRRELYFPTILTCWNRDWLLLRSYCGGHIRCFFLGGGGGGDGSTAQKDWGFEIGYGDALCAVAFQPTLVFP